MFSVETESNVPAYRDLAEAICQPTRMKQTKVVVEKSNNSLNFPAAPTRGT
ncbi:hypothetical protein PCASD_16436 [Puccinia coronata f. sp. avenae]|uniref:Uncharacterized protein n=1 Tax=Puccinia coronata f. sp. avenae TaxID=200324 RepID=A0A2N5U3M5_9BASI|nr:hypothetical protein PCASD_16436 [Puccinia coronata f. sp. avenae]